MDELEKLFKKHGYKKIVQYKEYANLKTNYDFKKKNIDQNYNNKRRDYIILPKENIQKKNYDFDELSNYLKRNFNSNEIILNYSKNIDHKVYKKLQNGELNPEDKIDLHGCKIDEAYDLFIEFIKRNFIEKRRLVLIVTGLSDHNDDSIRNNILKWINGSHDLQKVILYFGIASKKHGGYGAFYCYLSRR
jgi:DNA-nicking Smr family endonuclease